MCPSFRRSHSEVLRQSAKNNISSSFLAPPPTTADIATSSNATLNKLEPPSRRFPKYETPVTTTTASRGWGEKDERGPRWRGDGSRSGAGDRGGGWGTEWGGGWGTEWGGGWGTERGGGWGTERGEGKGGSTTNWGGSRKQARGGGRNHSAGKNWLWKYLEKPREAKEQVGRDDVTEIRYVYYEDELCVAIYDGYPKAKYHVLLVAKGDSDGAISAGGWDGQSFGGARAGWIIGRPGCPDEPENPKREANGLGAQTTTACNLQCANASCGGDRSTCGYHAIPSAEPLHLHIISQDFDSPWLKRPSHWISFTTDFFLDCSWVEARLEELGSLELDMKMYRRLELQPMQCFRCGWMASDMKSLKKHNLECAALLPAGGGGAASSHDNST
eukprot:jgi/Undpi1/975/HiC_scaffold_10.g04439.m1